MPKPTKHQTIKRHQTAIRRPDFSFPVRLALEANLITIQSTVLDYGCGRGDDVRRLQARGIACDGWDPVYYPNGKRQEADVVNLGYVVNVIEEPDERSQTLQDAWRFAHTLLIVAARLPIGEPIAKFRKYADGYLTQRGTFQKFYTQQELSAWIDSTLDVKSVAAGPGVFFVFRDTCHRIAYVAARYHRTLSIPDAWQAEVDRDRAKKLLKPLMDFAVARGRVPHQTEITNTSALCGAFGNMRRTFAMVRRLIKPDQWDRIRHERSQDLLVYLALEIQHGVLRFSALPQEMQHDIRAFFGTYTRATTEAKQLLDLAKNIKAIDVACKAAPCGKLTREALYVHRSGLSDLPAILRTYEGLTRSHMGDIEEANLIKLNRRSLQVSYLSYPDFDRDPHPSLAAAWVVRLEPFQFRFLDYRNAASPPILHRKETFVSPDYPLREKFARLTHQEEKWGLYENASQIGTRSKWLQLLSEKGLRFSGHRVVGITGKPQT